MKISFLVTLITMISFWGDIGLVIAADEVAEFSHDSDTFPRRMPGEFETQDYLLLSCGELTETFAETLAEIAKATRDSIRVVILYSEVSQRETIERALFRQMDSMRNIYLLLLSHNTKWVRDYGPTVIQGSDGQRCVVNWLSESGWEQDDQLPIFFAGFCQAPCETASIILQGGNLLSNGMGLTLTTTDVFVDNAHFGVMRTDLPKQLGSRVGADEIIVLEPIASESTGHVDMFATFTGSNTVVVGEYSKEEDEQNSMILDANAERLEEVITSTGPMRVERIPMGRNDDGIFRSYTNCIYANGVLVVPTYRDDDEAKLNQALAVYRRLLPGWRIACVDASEIIEGGGALHCTSLNIPRISDRLPLLTLPLEVPVEPLFTLDAPSEKVNVITISSDSPTNSSKDELPRQFHKWLKR